MNYKQYQESIENQLNTLNLLIDEKILHGLSYRSEAKRHRELIQQARRERRQPFFARLAGAIALF